MISLIEGEGVGAGKSYLAVWKFIAPHLARGGTCYTNEDFELLWDGFTAYVADEFGVQVERDQWQTFRTEDTWRLHEVTPSGTEDCPVLIVIDEGQAGLNARDFRDTKKRELFDWCCQSRHDDNDLLFISQSAANLDAQIRRLATHQWRVKNMRNVKIPMIGQWPFNQFHVQRFGQGGKTLHEWGLPWMDKRIFEAYRSKACRGRHTRAAGEVGRKQLAKTEKPTRKMRLGLIFLLAALGFGGWKTYEMFKATMHSERPQSKAVATPVPSRTFLGQVIGSAATPVPAPYEIRAEEFRGTDGLSYLRTDRGTYQKGELSPVGFVVGIRGMVARLATPEGRVVFVVAGDARSVAAAGLSRPASASATPRPLPVLDSAPIARAQAGLPPDDREADRLGRIQAGLPPIASAPARPQPSPESEPPSKRRAN